MGRRGRAKMEREFDVARVIKRYINLVDDILDKG